MRTLLLIPLVAAACGGGTPTTTTTPAPPPKPEPPVAAPTAPAKPTKPVTNRSLQAVGLDPTALDRSADPCEDFYQFACGGWLQKTEIPADKPAAERSFVEISDRNQEYLHGILEEMRTKPGNDPVAKQLAAYYGSCMDEAQIDKVGLAPLRPYLAQIDKITDTKSLTKVIGQLHALGVDVLFRLRPEQDSADATKMIATIDQGGLGLPDRDYYLKDDEHTKSVRAAYQTFVENILTAIGRKTAKQDAADIVALETAIAKVSKDKVARRDPKGMYNKIDRAGVAKAMPKLDWDAFWSAVNLKDVKDVNATSPEFLAGVDALLASTKPSVWRAYLAFHLTSRSAPFLTPKLEDTRFKLMSMLTGQPEQPPRWKRCTDRTDAALGDLLGQVFVRDRFGGQSKQAAEEEVHAIVAAMTANLDTLPWMDAQTKAKAKTKLEAMNYQIGYPKKWRTYDFKLDPKQWTENAFAAQKHERARQLAKIGKPVDKDDWLMSAPTVNAYYDPQLNGMVFPAGILQPPFYSVESSIPVNLGGMGMVVGHELTHGFDDEGAQYDALGNLVNWWQPETEKLFKQRTQCVADQYGGYDVSGGGKLNGKQTLGENIADIGGIKLALAAYRSLRAPAEDTVVADGFTEDQQFFLGFGQAWCAKLRPDYEKMLSTIDVHSPPHWRVDGALSATPEFAKAFRCKAGQKMVPAKQCVVW